MADEQTYFRTVVKIEILGTEPYAGDITDISEDITDGMFSGMELKRKVIEVDEAVMSELLVAQGSDPSFLIQVADGTYDPSGWLG